MFNYDFLENQERYNHVFLHTIEEGRAELVFKCIKGFLMERAGLGGICSGSANSGSTSHQYYTIQFLLPPEISEDVFCEITEMLPTIYHLVNPVMATDS